MLTAKRRIKFTVVIAAIVFIAVAEFLAQSSRINAACVDNLKQIGAALKAYANDAKGERYPPLSTKPGKLMFEAKGFSPEYLTNTAALVSPFHPIKKMLKELALTRPWSTFDDQSYWYIGYTFVNERSALAWIDAYRKFVPEGSAIPDVEEVWPEYIASLKEREEAIKPEIERYNRESQHSLKAGPPRVVPLDAERNSQHALREGVERFRINDIGNPASSRIAQKEIPVMIERPELHGSASHVLFMDGHVEFLTYPGPFPMTKDFIEGLRSLNRLRTK